MNTPKCTHCSLGPESVTIDNTQLRQVYLLYTHKVFIRKCTKRCIIDPAGMTRQKFDKS